MTVVLFPDPPGSEENQRSRLCVKSVGRGGEGRGGEGKEELEVKAVW